MFRTRVFSAGTLSFVVEASAESIVQHVEWTLSDLSTEDLGVASIFRILDHGDLYYLQIQEYFELHPTYEEAVGGLITAVNRSSLDADGSRLHVHAGAASLEGRAVMVVAPSGGGKTTMIASLVMNGWTYMSDEVVALTRDDNQIHCWPKPLSVKRRGFELFDAITARRVEPLDNRAIAGTHVPASSLGCSIASGAEPELIVFLTKQDNVPTATTVSPASALVRLIEQTMDFERFGDTSLMTLAALCGRCETITLPRDEPKNMLSSVWAYWSSEASAPINPVELVLGTSRDFVDIEAVALGDEVVVRNTRSGRIAMLNNVGAATLNSLVGSGDCDKVSDPAHPSFRQGLEDAGLLSTAITAT